MSSIIHPETRIGYVELKVSHLEQSITFYRNVVGLELERIEGGKAYLSAHGGVEPLLVLEQPEGVFPQGSRTTGLYHFALLLPTRQDFATAFFHILRSKETIEAPTEQESRYTYSSEILPISRLNSASDHTYSEAFYLQDLDGNGIEIYADRPRDVWPPDGRGGSHPLDLKSLAGIADYAFKGLPAGTVVGHVHLRVADIDQTRAFYVNALGFEEQISSSDVLFVSAGGYHHHIGTNTWNGKHHPYPGEQATGLKLYSIVLPHNEALEDVKKRLAEAGYEIVNEEHSDHFITTDPNGIGVKFTLFYKK
ncbi:VOC family protein [Paenibacillus sp. SYP-B3998]|uniref:VOC family protein n=1 Tax=Paenibacillus sp. SYP-B3998 TaxID=2678564 RepID=A0A6G3ZSI6_9BACL|nr:VOC family protein [Paenibacillus sp. SYP-B3998]NEW05085.1 VOC family protein [Paenibacillus sp. SYP-B3998]